MSKIRPCSSNADAAQHVASLAQSLLGSNSGVKCVVQDDRELYVRSAALLLQNLDIQHPIGQYVVSTCHSFDKEHGTAVNTLLFLIGAFTRAATTLMDKGIPRDAVLTGLDEAVERCQEKMREVSISIKDIILEDQRKLTRINDSNEGKMTCVLQDHQTQELYVTGNREKKRMIQDDKDLMSSVVPPIIQDYKGDNIELLSEKRMTHESLDNTVTVQHNEKVSRKDTDLKNDDISKLEINNKDSLLTSHTIQHNSALRNQTANQSLPQHFSGDIENGASDLSKNITNSHFVETETVMLKMNPLPDKDEEEEDIGWFFEDDHVDINLFIPHWNSSSQYVAVNETGSSEKTKQTSYPMMKQAENVSDTISESVKIKSRNYGLESLQNINKSGVKIVESSLTRKVCKDSNSVEFIHNTKELGVGSLESGSVMTKSFKEQIGFKQGTEESSDSDFDDCFDEKPKNHGDLLSMDKSSDDEFDLCFEPTILNKSTGNRTSAPVGHTGYSVHQKISLQLQKLPLDEPRQSFQGGLNSSHNESDSLNNIMNKQVDQKVKMETIERRNKDTTQMSSSLSGLERLLAEKVIILDKKSSKPSTILNNSRHFKTVGSSAQSSNDSEILQNMSSSSNSSTDQSKDDLEQNIDTVAFQKVKNDNSDNSILNDGFGGITTHNDMSKQETTLREQSRFPWQPEVQSKNCSVNEAESTMPIAMCNKKTFDDTDKEIKSSEVVQSQYDSNEDNSHSKLSIQTVNLIQKHIQNSQKQTVRRGLKHSRHFTDEEDVDYDTAKQCHEKMVEAKEEKIKQQLENCKIPSLASREISKAVFENPVKDVHRNSITDSCEMTSKESKNTLIASLFKGAKLNGFDPWRWLYLIGRGLSHGAEDVMDTVVEAVMAQYKQNEGSERPRKVRLDVSKLHCCIVPGSLTQTPQLVNGFVLPIPSDTMTVVERTQGRQLSSLIVNGEVSETFRHIGYKKSANVKKIYTGEEYLQTQCSDGWLSTVQHTLNKFSVKVLLARGSISEDVKVMCESHGIITIDNIPYKALLSLSTVTQTTMATYILDICPDNIFHCLTLTPYSEEWMYQCRSLTYVKVTCGDMPLQTCVISHPVTGAADLAEQKFWHCAYSMSSALQGEFILLGGGETEEICCHHLLKLSESLRSQPRTDIFIPVIFEEMALALLDYSNVVKTNNHLHPMIFKTRTSAHLQFTEGHSVALFESTHSFDDCDLGISSSVLKTANRGVKYGEEKNSLSSFSSLLSDSCEIPVLFDDLESKLAAFETALNTVKTILMCDAYIVTGLYNSEDNQHCREDIIL